MLTGCSIGPKVITHNRNRYNDAVQITAREEMLLNLVRVKYEDPPEFLGIDGITTQFEVNSSLTAGGELRTGSALQNRFGAFLPEATVGTADIPTVSLTPLQNEEFVRRFLSPISVETIYLLSRSGEDVERVFRLIVEAANGLENAPGSLDSRSADTAGSFLFTATMLGELARQRQIEVAYEQSVEEASHAIAANLVTGRDAAFAADKGYKFQPTSDGKSVVLTKKKQEVVLRIAPEARTLRELEQLAKVLRLKEGQLSYPLKPALKGQLEAVPQPESRTEILLSTRSVEDILHFLASDISVPLQHVQQGLVRAGEASAAEPLLRVCTCKKRPPCAAVAVHYRGYWFYIDDRDLNSKLTFDLLLDLYNLEIRGGGARNIPVLTLNVGRR